MKPTCLAAWMLLPFVAGVATSVTAGTSQTISFPEITDRITSDGPISLNASSNSGLPVSYFLVSNGNVATLIGSTLTLTGNPGAVTIKASQAGDGTFDPAADVFRSFVVGESSQRFLRVASGPSSRHSLGVRADGTLWAWGSNTSGQLGDGTTTTSRRPIKIGSATNWTSGSCGASHTAALRSDGTLWTWGSNSHGQLGGGTTRNRPLQIGVESSWIMVACGFSHTVALRSDGTLWSWGINTYGQLGDGTSTNRTVPVQVGVESDWVTVSCGDSHTIAVRSDGSLWAWGYNGNGQIGDGTTNHQSAPVRIGLDTNWAQVACGRVHTIAIRDDGTLWTWGSNEAGQLGDGTNTNRPTPVQVGNGTDWIGISGGEKHTLALRSGNSLWAWGSNSSGNVGDGTGIERRSPVRVGDATDWASIICGAEHSLALRTNGSLWAWGAKWSAQLGDGDTTVPVRPADSDPDKPWATVAGGYYHMAGVRDDHTLWTWGDNWNGALGDGSAERRTRPIRIGADANWVKVACGGWFTIATRADGSLWSWGRNDYGQLGLGSTESQMTPARVGSASNWSTVACGNSHAMAIRTDGTLWGWGANWQGSLGDGSEVTRLSPVPIGSASNWAKVACGYNHTVALRTDGTLWACGAGSEGQLGNASWTKRTTPVQVGTDSNWSDVSCGFDHTIALKNDGTIWAWGNNSSNQLGVPGSDRNTPVQIGNAGWSKVACGDAHTIAIRNDGTLWGWGRNYLGQLGDGTTSARSTPTRIGGGDGWIDLPVSLGFDFSGAMPMNRTLWTWGTHFSGSLGQEACFFPTRIWPPAVTQQLSWPTYPTLMYLGDSAEFEVASSSGLPVTVAASGTVGLEGSILHATEVGFGRVMAYTTGDAAWIGTHPESKRTAIRRTLPIVVTERATSVTATSAVVGGEVLEEGGLGITMRGVIFGRATGTTIATGVAVNSPTGGAGPFIIGKSDLLEGTTYFAVAFGTDPAGSVYGDEIVFTTDTTVKLRSGFADFNRSIWPGDHQVFTFTLDRPSIAVLATTGGASLRAELRDEAGNGIASFSDDGDFTISEILEAGDYVLEISRQPGAGSPQNYHLSVDASEEALVQPDVAVGASAARLVGRNVFLSSGQTTTILSRQARRVSGTIVVANRGKRPDALSVQSGKGSSLFDVNYFGPEGNMTAGLVTGSYRTPVTAAGSEEIAFLVSIQPNSNKLVRKSGKRLRILRKTLVLPVSARSTIDSSGKDAATIQVIVQ